MAQLAPGGQPQLNLPRTTLTAGMHRIDAQVASTNAQRQIGLMHRQDMPQTEGMLFVFEQPAVQCFWMKNTLIPLTAAFVADDGTCIGTFRTADLAASQRGMAEREVNARWQAEMAPFFDGLDAPADESFELIPLAFDLDDQLEALPHERS